MPAEARTRVRAGAASREATPARVEPVEREAICRYLAGMNIAHATLQFCERFDEKSRIWNFSKHSHRFFELIFFLEGKANIDAGDESVDVLGFDVVIYPPELEHAEHLDLRHRQEIICLWADAGPTEPFGHAIKLMDERGSLRSLFEMVYAEFTANRPCSEDLISAYLKAIFLQVRQHFSEPARESNMLVERCLGYIHENYAGDFDIDDLASQVAVSPSYLFRLFKKKMDVTPMHYRNIVRIDKAKLLLADQHLTVDEVAERVGFDDPKYFARVFRDLAGTTPSAFRRARLAD